MFKGTLAMFVFPVNRFYHFNQFWQNVDLYAHPIC